MTIINNRIRFLFILLGDQSKASSRVRGFWVVDELIKMGHDCYLVHSLTKWDFIKLLPKLLTTDIIVFQKCYSRWHLVLQKLAICFGKKTILDLDDKYSRSNNLVTYKNICHMIKRAYAVSAGCQVLVDFALPFNKNTILLASSIHLQHYSATVKRNQDNIVIGWIGNGNDYYRDLIEILLEPLTIIAIKHTICFKLIGACGRKELYRSFDGIEGLNIQLIDNIDWSSSKQLTNVLSDIDIGVYPLLENDFNLYKCAYKALEYMAMEIPVIASPVGANCDVIKHGHDGLLASNCEEWIRSLSLLISNESKRKQIGKTGRSKIIKQYNTKSVASKLVSLIEKPSRLSENRSRGEGKPF